MNSVRGPFVKLPREDPQFGTGMLGKLNVCLYGTRDAAKAWQEDLSKHLLYIGFTRGRGRPAVFHHRVRGRLAFVHGDDYVCSGEAKDLPGFEQHLATQYRIQTQRLEALKDGVDDVEAKVLNRIFRRTRRCYEMEADPRFTEFILEQMKSSSIKILSTPGVFEAEKE